MSDARIVRSQRHRLVGAVLAAALFGVALVLTGCAQPQTASVAVPSFAPLVQAVLPAVVNVSALQRPNKAALAEPDPDTGKARHAAAEGRLPRSTLDDMLRRFFDQQEKKGGPNLPGLALGSGFIIDPRGYVVTNNHVVENADTGDRYLPGQEPAHGEDHRPRRHDRSRAPEDRCRRTAALCALGRQRRGPGRRLGDGDRQPVRPRRHRQHRHRLGARPRHPRRPL